ncbi:hypothetical protein Tco_0869577 [Tanacetum coccineum]
MTLACEKYFSYSKPLPEVKHSIPVCQEAKELIETEKVQLAEGMLNEAYNLFTGAFTILQQVTGPMHREVANCCRYGYYPGRDRFGNWKQNCSEVTECKEKDIIVTTKAAKIQDKGYKGNFDLRLPVAGRGGQLLEVERGIFECGGDGDGEDDPKDSSVTLELEVMDVKESYVGGVERWKVKFKCKVRRIHFGSRRNLMHPGNRNDVLLSGCLYKLGVKTYTIQNFGGEESQLAVGHTYIFGSQLPLIGDWAY